MNAESEVLDYETLATQTDKMPLRMWLRLFTCTTLIERELSARLRSRFGITLAQFDYLSQLFRTSTDGLPMRELSARLMVTNGNVTGLTDRLARDGLVARHPGKHDRRVQIVKLTEQGEQTFAKIAEAHEAWVKEMFGGVDAKSGKELMKLLGELKGSATNAIEAGDAD